MNQHVTLTLDADMLHLLSDLLDINDDDEELADNSGASLETVAGLREAVAAALKSLH